MTFLYVLNVVNVKKIKALLTYQLSSEEYLSNTAYVGVSEEYLSKTANFV